MRKPGKQGLMWAVFFCLALPSALAAAKPGDPASVARARLAYDEAMKGSDPGLQNARRAELNYQLSMARKRHAHKAAHNRHMAQAAGQEKPERVEESHPDKGVAKGD